MFTGFIDKHPIELAADISSEGIVDAVYVYSNYNEPIILSGTLKNNKLVLYEKGSKNKNRAKFTFNKFYSNTNRQEGIWTDLRTNKELKISLNKTVEINYGDTIEWKNKELLQSVSINNKYFKLIVSKSKDDYYATVSEIKIIEKKTNKLIQTINVDCQLNGLNSISTGDFNFDGVLDFSIFETSYSGANSSSLYYLYDKKSSKYIESGFTGISLEFDPKTKRIYERNQCCAGTQIMTAEYKVVNNKMVLIKENCYIWDETRQELIERKLKDCQ